jgi:hypothetical protein
MYLVCLDYDVSIIPCVAIISYVAMFSYLETIFTIRNDL